MQSLAKIKELKEKINELQTLVEDFINLHDAKKKKIGNLETEIDVIKKNMNKHLDDLEELIGQK